MDDETWNFTCELILSNPDHADEIMHSYIYIIFQDEFLKVFGGMKND